MIKTSTLPILITIAFSLWGLIIMGTQYYYMKAAHEFRRMFYASLFLIFLLLTNIALFVFMNQKERIFEDIYNVLSLFMLFCTIISIYLFNNFFIIRRKRYQIFRSLLYMFLIIIFGIVGLNKILGIFPIAIIVFVLFLLMESCFVLFTNEEQKSSLLERVTLTIIYLMIIAVNMIDFFIQSGNLAFGIGIIGLMLPLYFMVKYMELQQNILENAILIKEILEKERKSYSSSIYLVVNMLESKNGFIKGHSERVSFYAGLIAMKLGLSAQELEDLQNACLLHDIGFISISFERILNKGIYSASEFEQIKKHPFIGAEILSKSSIFSRYAEIILYHHENWNGSGYPTGIRGEKIPLFSRIIQIADNFDIMTTDKFYRSALSKEDALLILKSGRGEEYDPRLVDIFIKSVRI